MSKTISLRIPDFLARLLIGKTAYDYLKDESDAFEQPVLTRKANVLGFIKIEVFAIDDTNYEYQSDKDS